MFMWIIISLSSTGSITRLLVLLNCKKNYVWQFCNKIVILKLGFPTISAITSRSRHWFFMKSTFLYDFTSKTYKCCID